MKKNIKQLLNNISKKKKKFYTTTYNIAAGGGGVKKIFNVKFRKHQKRYTHGGVPG